MLMEKMVSFTVAGFSVEITVYGTSTVDVTNSNGLVILRDSD